MRSSENERIARQIGGVLRRIRLERQRRQRHVAEAAGITRGKLCSYERGRLCPSLPTLVSLLTALDCSPEEFGQHLGPWGCLP
jgi:transcriptional regulator with XRE-family HTH domain